MKIRENKHVIIFQNLLMREYDYSTKEIRWKSTFETYKFIPNENHWLHTGFQIKPEISKELKYEKEYQMMLRKEKFKKLINED